MKIDPTIFGMYDIRGVYGQNLTDSVVNQLGKAMGTFFQNHQVNKVFVGRDNRLSGPTVKENLFKGLVATGMEVVDLGLITTPMIYFAWNTNDAQAAIMITASHNPAPENGFKVSLKKQPLLDQDYQQIRQLAESDQLTLGSGKVSQKNLWPDYLAYLIRDISLARPLKVAVDCANGATALFSRELFTKAGVEFFGLYDQSDGSFPNHPPYPQKVEFYQELSKLIKEKKADLGLAFDGDGDRIGVFDENGKFIPNDILTILFLRQILKNYPRSKIVMNISTSLAVIDDVKNHQGELILWKTGYPFISAKMKELGAIFGGEISGHFFFNDRFYGADDAFYASLRALEILASSKQTLSEFFKDIPQFFNTPEFRIPVPATADKFSLISQITQEIKKEYPQAKILDFDGVRFSFNDGWGLIRASNTQPMLTGRAEARNEVKLEEIKALIKNKLNAYQINLDWEHPITE